MKLPEGCASRVPVEPDEIEPEQEIDLRMALKSCSHLYLARPLTEGGHVELWVSGRVKGLQRVERQTIYMIEVLDAEVREPERRT